MMFDTNYYIQLYVYILIYAHYMVYIILYTIIWPYSNLYTIIWWLSINVQLYGCILIYTHL